ncbi:MAG: M14 family metallocarboxypeptidase [Bdellovibrionales bacterium]|nr:M14 family metallocarboxypeptidase [Bdellovibrionales bacterium]
MTELKPFKGWDSAQVEQWRSKQRVQRSYEKDLVSQIESLANHFRVTQYGHLEYEVKIYPLYLLQSKNMHPDKPTIMITGGVHGYETSGAHGALAFMATQASNFEKHFNFVCAPCVSPWGYETINRWNPNAHDPNRNFFKETPVQECSLLMKAIDNLYIAFLAHFDLHETTDTDNSVFRPTLALRDNKPQDNWDIPDGFYLVADTSRKEIPFQKAIIDNVKNVTHIAPSDKDGKIIGESVLTEGVVAYDAQKLKLCKILTKAKYVTTTEVYPDSPKTNPEECIRAQVAAIIGGLNYLTK